MSDTVSVIIPIYNGERFLEETIHTIQNSNYQNLEIILVDDGSTDSSSSICKKMQVNDGRIKYFLKTNGGIADARNYGLSKATGDYVCFVDQDDIVQPNMYKSMVDRIQKDKSDFAIGGTGKFTGSDFTVYESYEDCTYDRSEIFIKLFTPMMFGYLIPPMYPNLSREYCSIWKCMFRTKFIKENELKFVKLIDFEDDHTFLSEAYLHASCVSALSDVCYLWRINLSSESYTFKYLPDLKERQNSYHNYFLGKLTERVVDSSYIIKWEENLDTQFAISCLENVCSMKNPANCFEKIRELHDITLGWLSKYGQSSTIVFRKGVIKKRIIFFAMKTHLYWLLPGIIRSLNYLGSRYQKSSFLTNIERRLKK